MAKKLTILIIAVIFLASCATAPVQKSGAPGPVIASEEIEATEAQPQPETGEEVSPAAEASSEQAKKVLKVFFGDDPVGAIMGWWAAGGFWF